MPCVRPPSLLPGSTLRIVAPASPLPSLQQFFAGLGWLRSRYRVRMSRDVLAREGYLAGGDAQRLTALQSALDEEGTDAIVMARGGYGITRLLEQLDWRRFAARPKWIVGFSDATALHLAASDVGVCSLHASNVNGLASAASLDRDAWLRALEGHAAREMVGLRGSAVGEFSGPAFGGNLALLQALAAQGRLAPPAGAIWFVEDIGERPYRLDRMAYSLRAQARTAAAIVLGEFVGCQPGPDEISAHSALVSAWGDLGVPLVYGAPFGHGVRNTPLVMGARVQVRIAPCGGASVQL